MGASAVPNRIARMGAVNVRARRHGQSLARVTSGLRPANRGYGLSLLNAWFMRFGSPVFRPYRNHRTRCSLEPCVNASGTT